MNARFAETVQRVGFRKWYERQLLSSHAYMVLTFLSVIALLGTMEAYRTAQGDARAGNVLLFLACAFIGGWALRRYLFLLGRADYTANQASCPACGEYGRFGIVGQCRDGALDVSCRKCSHQWGISLPP
ncbi:MAG: hypothetical protein EOO24_43290 [Comamonadaceae bacterium]|nr:MAG: hypothetical protein EOO24_43290 [Comamonadaceae bacterium]